MGSRAGWIARPAVDHLAAGDVAQRVVHQGEDRARGRVGGDLRLVAGDVAAVVQADDAVRRRVGLDEDTEPVAEPVRERPVTGAGEVALAGVEQLGRDPSTVAERDPPPVEVVDRRHHRARRPREGQVPVERVGLGAEVGTEVRVPVGERCGQRAVERDAAAAHARRFEDAAAHQRRVVGPGHLLEDPPQHDVAVVRISAWCCCRRVAVRERRDRNDVGSPTRRRASVSGRSRRRRDPHRRAPTMDRTVPGGPRWRGRVRPLDQSSGIRLAKAFPPSSTSAALIVAQSSRSCSQPSVPMAS